jgi:hypothetical protein
MDSTLSNPYQEESAMLEQNNGIGDDTRIKPDDQPDPPKWDEWVEENDIKADEIDKDILECLVASEGVGIIVDALLSSFSVYIEKRRDDGMAKYIAGQS